MRSRKKADREVDEDLLTRTSWVNAELAYKHVKKVSTNDGPSLNCVRKESDPPNDIGSPHGHHRYLIYNLSLSLT
jgi:hypothetical protein